MKRLSGALKADILKNCVIINADTPSENRRFVKKNFEGTTDIKILSDENLEWMREYTALGEKVSVAICVYNYCLSLLLVSLVLCRLTIYD